VTRVDRVSLVSDQSGEFYDIAAGRQLARFMAVTVVTDLKSRRRVGVIGSAVRTVDRTARDLRPS